MFIIDHDPTIDLRFRPSSRPWTSRRETKDGLAEARPSEAMAAPAGFAAASRSRRLQAAGCRRAAHKTAHATKTTERRIGCGARNHRMRGRSRRQMF